MIGLIVAVILGIVLIGVVLKILKIAIIARAGHRRADAAAEQVRDEADPLMGYTGPLADKDRIFTNVYGFQEPWLKAAQQRGDWDNTKGLIAHRPGRDHRRDQGLGPARPRRRGLPDRHEVELHAQGAQARQTQLPGHQRRRIRARKRARTARSSATIRTS